jgi:two-component system nitrogen regulation response regulator NtrX
MAADILIVDDEADIRELIAGILQDEGFETRLAHNSDAALGEVDQRRPSLIILDIWLQARSSTASTCLNVTQGKHPEVPVIIISGHGNIETAVAAIKRGAYEYIEKPFKADRLISRRPGAGGRGLRENEELKGRAGTDTEPGLPPPCASCGSCSRKSPGNSRVLITGPMGGQELAAHPAWPHAVPPVLRHIERRHHGAGPHEEELFGVE